MAADSSVLSLQDELSCSICLEYFKEPVSIHCGHNYCRACISQCWGETDTNFTCPQCRETAQQKLFRPNRELGKVVEIARQLSFQVKITAGGEQGCELHREALKLFCDTDHQLICVICRESQVHRAHTVFPVEEAAQQYKKQIQTQLQTLKEEREKLLGLKVSTEGRSREYLVRVHCYQPSETWGGSLSPWMCVGMGVCVSLGSRGTNTQVSSCLGMVSHGLN
nr:zinc finger protein RFP-like [Chrysemys picta bellii]